MKNSPRFGGILIFLMLTALCIPALAAKDDLSFSLKSGFYAQPQQLEITAEKKGAVIYYTMDGSAPGENSLRYEGPIFLSDTTEKYDPLSQIGGVTAEEHFIPLKDFPSAHVVRAAALLPGGEWTEQACGTYFIGFDRQQLYGDLPIISLIIDADHLFDYETGIYVLGKTFEEWDAKQTQPYDFWGVTANFTNRGKEWEREVMVDFMLGEGNDFSQLMGVRIKGEGSRGVGQKSFRLIAREEYGAKNIRYPLFPGNLRESDGGLLQRYKSFSLRNGGNDRDNARIRDPFIQTLSEGLCFANAGNRPAIAFVNGEYWGIYTLNEEFSDNYVQYHYSVDNENVITFKNYRVEDGTEADAALFWDMMLFINRNNMANSNMYARASEMLDMQSFADSMALQAYIFNQDGTFQCHNWQMWRARVPDLADSPYADGKWRVMMFDTDYSSGVYEEGKNFSTNNLAQFVKRDWGDYDPPSLLIELLKNKEFKQMFILSLCDVRNLYFNRDRVTALQQEMDAQYSPYMPDNYRRFGPSWITNWDPDGHMERNMNALNTFFLGRYKVFINHIQAAFGLQKACAVTVRTSAEGKGTVYINNRNIPIEDRLLTYYFPEYPITVTASAGEGAQFKGWTVSNGNAQIEDPSALTTAVTFTGPVTVTAHFE